MLLEAQIMRNGEAIYHALAFNDVVVNRSGFSGMAELRVSVDGRFMYNQRSDGLIVATPTGSTAYAHVVGGADPASAVAGHRAGADRAACVVEPAHRAAADSKVSIQIIAGRDVNVNFDMQSFTALELNDSIDRAPFMSYRAVPASGGLQLLRHAAQEAALARTSVARGRSAALNTRGKQQLEPTPTGPLSMLRHLSIRDFVIVAALDLEFDGGFTVFSGETGAGKSILIDALALALGARADASVVRTARRAPTSPPASRFTRRSRNGSTTRRSAPIAAATHTIRTTRRSCCVA